VFVSSTDNAERKAACQLIISRADRELVVRRMYSGFELGALLGRRTNFAVLRKRVTSLVYESGDGRKPLDQCKRWLESVEAWNDAWRSAITVDIPEEALEPFDTCEANTSVVDQENVRSSLPVQLVNSFDDSDADPFEYL
jgi:hypothetical protein